MLNGLDKKIERLTKSLSLKNIKGLKKYFYAFRISYSSGFLEISLHGKKTEELFLFLNENFKREKDNLSSYTNICFINFTKAYTSKDNICIVNITLDEYLRRDK